LQDVVKSINLTTYYQIATMLNFNEINEKIKSSPLYSEDIAPLPPEKRTWSMWNLAALWVGVAVCIPTYLLASQMIQAGLSWLEAMIIIVLGNLLITVPMVLNGKAGVKYGLPFPVLARSAFGIYGVHIATLLRGLVACGWFGVQTWLGGSSIYIIGCVLVSAPIETELSSGQFIGFALFWLMNAYFIWRGTEQIRWLEEFAAPLLILIGFVLIGWGWYNAGGFSVVLQQSAQLAKPTVAVREQADGGLQFELNPIRNKEGTQRAQYYRFFAPTASGLDSSDWRPLIDSSQPQNLLAILPNTDLTKVIDNQKEILLQLKANTEKGDFVYSSKVKTKVQTLAQQAESAEASPLATRLWKYISWLTIIVGFWATMAISIADITRFTASQRNQVLGQFLGLPTTMAMYSFVGIFVTCAALLIFNDILVSEDAPWDPVRLLAKFENPVVVVIAQLAMLIATLSTNIAANIIAPAFAFANLFPRSLSFRSGGILAALIGVIICPWWLLGSIIGLLVFVSGLLGPVLGVMMSDYFVVRRQNLDVVALFDPNGQYKGVHTAAFVALAVGVITALLGIWLPALSWLYTLSWFSGFAVSFLMYALLARRQV
jgi:cytosine/uracil/thiamine/allantoin permease